MKTLIKGATIVSDNNCFTGSILINNERIERVYHNQQEMPHVDLVIEAKDMLLIPGVIDDQVHFREPGATHKGCIKSESAAAVLGGVTSYMDMPNNQPPVITIKQLEEKFKIAENSSYANYSFYLGASNENREELRQANQEKICGIKVFMGSSTGNMLVDNRESLEAIFKESKILIATHCEEEEIIKANLKRAVEVYGEDIPFREHSNIRSRESCIASSKKAIDLAIKYNSTLHILHISTKEEVEMIRAAKKENPKISAETCVHYLLFDNKDYDTLGSLIKCNPSIKTEEDKVAIIQAVKDGVIEVIATDHAPHTWDEKQNSYMKAPSGLPLVQHSLQIMLELYHNGIFTLNDIVERMAHSPAKKFGIIDRGYIREGYFADLVLIDLHRKDSYSTTNPAYLCKWSPLKGTEFHSSVLHTFINGQMAVCEGRLTGIINGKPLSFKRDAK